MHETSVRLVIGEGRTVGVWSGYSADDEWYAAIERVGGGIEGVDEVLGFTHLRSI